MTATRLSLFVVFALVLGWFGRDGIRIHAQTRPRPDQIRNIEQIRIACGDCDPRPGTLILQNQVDRGATIQTPTGIDWANPADAGKPTICVVTFLRVEPGASTPPRPPDWPAHNIERNVCYTQAQVLDVLKMPTWLKWWLANGGPPIVAGVPIGPVPNPAVDATIRDLVTHPRNTSAPASSNPPSLPR